MIVRLHKNFEKQYKQSLILRIKKLKESEKKKFQQRVAIFIQDEFNPILNNHPLVGKYQGYRSINVTGDLRAIYQKNTGEVVFVAVDSHSNLYG